MGDAIRFKRGNLVAVRLLLFYRCVKTLVRATEFRVYFILVGDNGLYVLIIAFTYFSLDYVF